MSALNKYKATKYYKECRHNLPFYSRHAKISWDSILTVFVYDLLKMHARNANILKI